MNKYKF